jgi:hypothetical protein
MKRTLTLTSERLAELTTGELTSVVGAQSGLTCPVGLCVEDLSEKLGCIGSYNCPTWEC